MLNLTRLFRNSTDDCYLRNLELAENQKDTLSTARKLIRETLRVELPKTLKEIVGQDFKSPRFFTQGSWAYKTLNAPAQHPQQADLDDGCYLPLSYIQEIEKPSEATTIFFEAVEKVLQPLADQNGWKLIGKPTCTRIEISRSSHIDIPLYAIPDIEFEKLTKAATALDFSEAVTAQYDSWDELPTTKVLLAHREEDWIDSDPRPVKEWFNDQCRLKTEQLRYVVRYIKGFRDQIWITGGPSSILLMAAVAPIFKANERRDDLALLDVLRSLPSELRKGVYNPANPTEKLSDRLSADELEKVALTFEGLTRRLAAALAANDPQTACNWLCHDFGDRLPNRPDLVTVTTPTETVKEVPPVITATPLVGRTEAG